MSTMSSMTALPRIKGEDEPHVVWLPVSGNDSEGTTSLANAGVASAHLKPGTVYARIVGRDFEFTMNEHMHRVTIGRQSDCSDVDIKIGLSSFISRRHVEIYRVDDEEGGGECGRVRFFIVSRGKNGIFINGIYQRLGADAMELPKICTLRFPSTTVKLLFQEVVVGGVTAAPIPAETNHSFESEVDKESKVDDSPSQLSTSSASTHLPVPVSTLPSSPVRPPPEPLRLISPVLPDARNRLEHHRAAMEFEPVSTDHMKSGSRKRPAEASAKSRSSKLVIDEQNGRSQFSDKDFSHNNYGKSKPPYSYAQLIAQAIASSTDHQLTLNDIYSFISQRYPYYKATDKGWQNSIRHNLSLNHCFIRVARSQDEPGKGSYWRIDPTAEKKMCEQAFRRRHRNAGPAAGDHKFRHQDSLDSGDADWKMDQDDYDDDIPSDQLTRQLVNKQNMIEQPHNSGDVQHHLARDAEHAAGTTIVALPAVSSPCTASFGLPPIPSLSVQRADPDTHFPSEQLVSPGAVQLSPTLLQSGSIIQPIQGQSQAVIRQILQRAVLISQTSQPGNGCLPVLTVPGVASLPRQQFQFVLGTARPTFIGSQTSFASSAAGGVERHPATATTMVRTDGQENSTPAPLHQT